MSKNTYIKEITREINRLNAIIDLKIIRGLPYKQEAQRHKFLKNQLQYIGWRNTINDFISTFAI